MFDENLLYSTQAILKYLINNGPGYQTVFSLNYDFYNYSRHNIPYYDLGYSYLVEFLQSIPDILEVNLSTFEVQPSLTFYPARDNSLFSNNQFKRPNSLQCCHFMQTPTSLHQPRSLKWARPGYASNKPNKRAFQPIPIRKPNSIVNNGASAPFPLGPRSYSDGKCSSPDSIESNVLEFNEKTESQVQALKAASEQSRKLPNYPKAAMNRSKFVPRYRKNWNYFDKNSDIQSDDLSSVQSQTENSDFDKKNDIIDGDFSSVQSQTASSDFDKNDIQYGDLSSAQSQTEISDFDINNDIQSDDVSSFHIHTKISRFDKSGDIRADDLSSFQSQTKNSHFDTNSDIQVDDSSSVQSQTDLEKDEKLKFEENLVEKNELDFIKAGSSTSKNSLSSYLASSTLDDSASKQSLSSSLASIPLGSMDLKFDETPPPAYSEMDDSCKALVYHRIDSYNYDLDYYLSSPEEKISPDEQDSYSESSAIPFVFTEDDDPITMLDSNFSNETYGSKYKTTPIDDVMKVGGFYELYVSEVNSPYKFWFQLDEESPNAIDELQEHLNMYYTMTNSHSSTDLIKKQHMLKGYACAALYKNIWHRGEFQGQPKDGSVKIFFVDYGTVEQVSIDDVRYLLDSFCKAPKLCYRGTLDFVKPLNHRWDVDTTSFFIGLVENKKLVAGVSEIDCKTNSVRLYLMDRENNININYQLVHERYAFPEDPRDRYQRHIADVQPSFDFLESGDYPSLAEVTALLQQNYDIEKLMEGSIIDDFDCIIPQPISDEETLQRVEAYKKTKEEAKEEAKQRDASIFLQFFGNLLKNPFMNGPVTEEIETSLQNPFLG